MSRKEARELAMKLVYQLDINSNDKDEQIEYALVNEKVDQQNKEYIKTIVEGTQQKEEEILDKLKNNLTNWTIDRVSKTDLSVLKIAIYEIMHMDDIPTKVSVNEAINLAKKYGSDQSGKFVHGVLGKVVGKNE